MREVVRWTPLGFTWPEEVRRWLENPWQAFQTLVPGVTAVPVEMYTQDGNVVVRAEVPGVDPKDLDVRITAEALTIRGEVRQEDVARRDGMYHTERRYGAFARSVSFPAPVDPARATATYRHGVLEVRAPLATGDPGGRKLDIAIH